MICIHLKNPS
jgi:hypothetical protein